ncbi:MAG: hypothetical protein ABW213_14375 [Tardiphaga sp.]
MKTMCAVVAASLLVTSPLLAGGIDQMADNLQISCANHFRTKPNRPTVESAKFCTCFSEEFISAFSLREDDLASGILTPEIQQQFARSADACGRELPPQVARAGRAWAMDSD